MPNEWKRVENTQAMWNPEENPSIEGVYSEKKTGIGPNNSCVYVLKQQDGTEVAFWGSTMIDDHMSKVMLNEEVRVEYLGKKKSKDGTREYKNFNIFHRPLPMVSVSEELAKGQ